MRNIFCLLTAFLLLASPLQAQQNQKRKKTPAPFQWVNPLQNNSLTGVKHGTFRSKLVKQDVGYCVYLPPKYDAPENAERIYPVVYYLHGGRPGSELKSVKLSTLIHEAMVVGKVAPSIYVFVNGGAMSHYNYPEKNSPGEDVFIQELIPHIDQTYRTIAAREGRGLEGFSQGGRGTTRIMFKHPDLFCSAAPGGSGYATEKRISEENGRESENLVFAPGYNTWDLARKYAENRHPPLKIMVHVGTKGFNYECNLEYMKFLDSLKIPYEKIIVPDVPHSAFQIYQKRGLELMKFHAENFRYSGPKTPVEKRKGKAERDPSLKPARVDRKVVDIEYARIGDTPLKLDLYLPPKSDKKPALVVWFHGGAWRAGSKDRMNISWLTGHNYAIASIQYRLTGVAKFPAQIHDGKAAVRWLRAHADEYGFRADSIGVAGSSAGGHLAALMATSNGVKELEGTVGKHLDESSDVQAGIDMYGMTDLYYNATVEGERCDKPDCPLYQLLGGKPSEHLDAAKLASPVFHVTADDPPIVILHGAQDTSLVRPFQGRFLHDLYQQHGLTSYLQIIPGNGHGGPGFQDAKRRETILNVLGDL